MSSYQPEPDWWVASDGRWYPPELHPARQAVATLEPPVATPDLVIATAGPDVSAESKRIRVLVGLLLTNAAVMAVLLGSAGASLDHGPLPLQGLRNHSGVVLDFGGDHAIAFFVVLGLSLAATVTMAVLLLKALSGPTAPPPGPVQALALLGVFASPTSVVASVAFVPNSVSVVATSGFHLRFGLDLLFVGVALFAVYGVLRLGIRFLRRGIPFPPRRAMTISCAVTALALCTIQGLSETAAVPPLVTPAVDACSLMPLSAIRALDPSLPARAIPEAEEGAADCTVQFGSSADWRTEPAVTIAVTEGPNAIDSWNQVRDSTSWAMPLVPVGGGGTAVWMGGLAATPQAQEDSGAMIGNKGQYVVDLEVRSLAPSELISEQVMGYVLGHLPG